MYLKYKGYIGELIHYEKLDREHIKLILLTADGVELRFTCTEYDIYVPNVMGNAKVLYELNKEGEEDD